MTMMIYNKKRRLNFQVYEIICYKFKILFFLHSNSLCQLSYLLSEYFIVIFTVVDVATGYIIKINVHGMDDDDFQNFCQI